MILRLGPPCPVSGRILLVERLIIIIEQPVFINKQNLFLLRTEGISCGILATAVRLAVQCECELDLIVCQVALRDVCRKDDADAMSAAGDMHQHHTGHQFLVLLQPIPDLHGVVHVIDIQHYESVQMTAHQLSRTSAPFGVKLITAEDERCQLMLQILGKSQKLLTVAFLGKLLPSLVRREFLRVINKKSLIVIVREPDGQGSTALIAFRPVYGIHDSPAGVYLPFG